MAQYKMISLSVNLGGRVVRKSETPKIDGDKFPAVDIAAAEKAGFIEKVKETKKSASTPQSTAKKTSSGKSETDKTNKTE